LEDMFRNGGPHEIGGKPLDEARERSWKNDGD